MFIGCRLIFFLYQHTSQISQDHLFPEITYLLGVLFPQGFDVKSSDGGQTVFTKQNANKKKKNFMQVLLAKLKADNKFYAVKVLQKKVILKKKEVGCHYQY